MINEERYEIIEGVKTFMSPAPNITHGTIIGRLYNIFTNYIDEHKLDAAVFLDHTDVHFTGSNLFMPDLSVICDANKIDRRDALYIVPDLVVEVLSPSSVKRDMGIKKDVYESSGVREYWIVNPLDKSILVYLLNDGKYILDTAAQIYPYELSLLDKMHEDEIKTEIKVTIFEDLIVDIHKVFKWWTDKD